ncbi:MAG TPA: MBL fold metallo-hydrolase [Thermomicrobiales bacterium]|nr:MBL fold metallo-hydrolase [Thermomicrobiales bacterium]
MRLTVLGGSAAGPNIGQGCAGFLAQGNGAAIVLDLGPGTLPELRRHADFRTLDAIVISHLHLDHILDLFALRFALAYNPIPPRRKTRLVLPPGGEAWFARAAALFGGEESAAYFGDVFAIEEFDPGATLAIGPATLRFASTVHYVPCWAIRLAFATASGDLAYTADTGPTADLDAFARGSAVILAEAAAGPAPDEPIATRGHLTPTEAGLLAHRAGAQTLVLTHIWEEHGRELALAQAAAVFTGRLELARPGLVVEW